MATVPDPIKKKQLKNGETRYWFVLDIGRDPETNRRLQLTKSYEDKAEAKSEWARIKHQGGQGTLVAPKTITVSEWLDTWLKSATVDVERATASNYADAL